MTSIAVSLKIVIPNLVRKLFKDLFEINYKEKNLFNLEKNYRLWQ